MVRQLNENGELDVGALTAQERKAVFATVENWFSDA